MNSHQILAIHALRRLQGEDLKEVEKHVDAGLKTHDEIFKEYEQKSARIEAAMLWVRQQSK